MNINRLENDKCTRVYLMEMNANLNVNEFD